MSAGLICLAHGSRDAEAPAVVETLAAAAGDELGVPAQAAALDLNEPDLTTAARTLARQGVNTIVVVPLLWTREYHFRVDVPAALAQAQRVLDEEGFAVSLLCTDPLGTGSDVARVLQSVASSGQSGQPDPTDPEDPTDRTDPTAIALYVVDAKPAHDQLAQELSALSGAQVTVVAATRAGSVEQQLAAVPADAPIVPLFVAPGLLLRRCRMPMHPPLGTALTPIVVDRFRRSLTA